MDKDNKNLNNEKKKNNKGMKTVWISAAVTLVVGLGAGYLVGKEQGRELPATSRHYSNNKVIATVGSVEHPMVDVHYIEWIYVETNKGGQRKALNPGEAPKAEFVMADGEVAKAVYAYCNLHGLWKTEI